MILATCVRYFDVLFHVFIQGVDDRAADIVEVPLLSDLVLHPFAFGLLVCFEAAPLLVQGSLRVHVGPANENDPSALLGWVMFPYCCGRCVYPESSSYRVLEEDNFICLSMY